MGWDVTGARCVTNREGEDMDLSWGSPALRKRIAMQRARKQLEKSLTAKLIERGRISQGARVEWYHMRTYLEGTMPRKEKRMVMRAV